MAVEVLSAQNFTDDYVLARDDILTLNIQKSLKRIIQNEGYISYSMNINVFPPDGGNYLAVLCEVDLKGKTVDKETNLFMKIMLPNEKLTIISLRDVYIKELFCYKDLRHVFEEVQDEVCLPEEERYHFMRIFDESRPEVIILENMARKGFKTLDRMELITLEYAEMAIKELAKFHALSFVLEARRPTYFEENIKTISHPLSFDKDYEMFIENMYKGTIVYFNGESRQKFEKLTPKILKKYPSYIRDTSGTKCCLCHGDYRPNNILIKKTDGKITKMLPIDYQLIHYGCPLFDLIYFTIPVTDQKFRRKYLSKLKDLYYEAMESFLNHFDLDLDSIYPREEFEKEYREKLDYGLIMSIILLPIQLTKEDEIPDLAGKPLAEIKLSTDDRYRDRIVGIVNDYIEWGYL